MRPEGRAVRTVAPRRMIQEIGRILVSLSLLVLAGLLYWLGFSGPEKAAAMGMTNVGSAIVGATITYWLKP